jgi:hypothetical protein
MVSGEDAEKLDPKQLNLPLQIHANDYFRSVIEFCQRLASATLYFRIIFL